MRPTPHLLLLAALLLPTAAGAESWSLLERKDAFTDQIRREACASDSNKNEVCFWFARDRAGLHLFWVSFALADDETRMLDHQRIPWLRVDGRKTFAHDTLLEIERTIRGEQIIPRRIEPRWLMWQATTQSKAGDDSVGRNQLSLLWQVAHGQTLKIRVFLTGGFQKDSEVELATLAPIIRQISPMKLD